MGLPIDMLDLEALIIDDEKDICYLLGTLLKRKHLDIAYVNTLWEAENILKTTHPDIVFLDNHLPDGLGVNFITRIKELHPKTKVVMITAHDNAEDRKNALSRGADYFIGKPFNRDLINKSVERLLP